MAIITDALTTLPRQKAFSEIRSANTAYDAILEVLIGQASKTLENYTNRRFRRQTYTNQVYDGTGSHTLNLEQYPVIASEPFTIQVRNAVSNIDDWDTIDSEDYFIHYDEGIVEYAGSSTTRSYQPVKFVNLPRRYRITYTAGYYLPQNGSFSDGASDSLPNNIELACNLLVSKLFRQIRRTGTGISEIRAQESTISFQKAILLDPTLKSIVDGFTKIDL